MSALNIHRVHNNFVTVKGACPTAPTPSPNPVGVEEVKPLCTHCFRMYHTERDLLDHQKKCLTKKRKLLFTAL